jgi:hypothetical protein
MWWSQFIRSEPFLSIQQALRRICAGCLKIPSAPSPILWLTLLAVSMPLALTAVFPQVPPSEISQRTVTLWGKECASEVAAAFQRAEHPSAFTPLNVFDRMYVPVPGTSPRRYRTVYDSWADQTVFPILKNRLLAYEPILYVLLMDRNGYVPVAPAVRHERQMPTLPELKGISDSPFDLEAARTTESDRVRTVERTAEGTVLEVIVPVVVGNRPWGVIRLGYLDR